MVINRIFRKASLLYWMYKERRSWYNDFQHFKMTAPSVLTPMQKKQVKSYFKKYGFEIKTDWHDYYTSLTGIFSEKYIPADLMYTVIVPYLNYMPFELSYQDKGMYWRTLPNVRKPRTIVQRIHSFYYDGQHKPITEIEALDICLKVQEAIIKPTINSCQGQGVKLITSSDYLQKDGKKLYDLLRNYGDDFILQEKVQQCDFLSSLNESSLNTMRILTLRIGNNILVLSTAIRIGGKGSITDNGYGGGYSCGINEDGTLKETGFRLTTGERVKELQNGTPLKGLTIPHFDKVIDKAKELHLTLPYLRIIGWDFTIDKDFEPVFIELNSLPGIYIMQLNNGPVFGKYTDEILRQVSKVKHTFIPKIHRTY